LRLLPCLRWPGVALPLVLLTTSCASSTDERKPVKAQEERKPAPDFALKDSTGQTVKLSEYRGKVVLLNFWATWCAPCRIEIPWFKEFETTYKDRGFAVLGVAMDEEGWEVVKPYVDDMQVNYRVLMGTEMVGEQYGGVGALPTTFLIDREGKIASTHVGLVSKSDYEQEINDLLGQAAGISRRSAVRGAPAVVVGAGQ